jgi:hypothetical protein
MRKSVPGKGGQRLLRLSKIRGRASEVGEFRKGGVESMFLLSLCFQQLVLRSDQFFHELILSC